MNSEIIVKIIAVILVVAAISIIILGIRGIPFIRRRRGTQRWVDQIPKRTALLVNLMSASIMIVIALAVFFPVILKYSIFILIGVIMLFLVILVAGSK